MVILGVVFLSGFFVVVHRISLAQTASSNLQFTCDAGNTPEAGSFTGSVSPGDGTTLLTGDTSALTADRQFTLTCKSNIDSSLKDSDSATAKAVAQNLAATIAPVACGKIPTTEFCEAGKPVTLSGTVTNNGAAPVGEFASAFQYSVDGSVPSNFPSTASRFSTKELLHVAPGNTFPFQYANHATNPTDERTWSFQLFADYLNQVTNETSETDNIAVTSVTFKKPSGTLSCTSPSFDKNRLSYTYQNVSGSVSLWREGFTTVLKTETARAASGSGAYDDAGRTGNTTDTYTLRNGTTATSPLLVSVPCQTPAEPKPDLTATTPTAALVPGTGASTGETNKFYEGSTARFTVTVTNDAKATANAPASKTGWKVFEATAQKQTPPLLVKDQSTESEASTVALAVGASAPVSRPDSVKVRVGTYYFGICADNPGSIAELNEDNNCSPSWLKIEVIPVPPNPLLSFTVNNQTATHRRPYKDESVISWNAQNVVSCEASAVAQNSNWSGKQIPSGSVKSAQIAELTAFTISCDPLPGSPLHRAGKKETRTVTVVPLSVDCAATIPDSKAPRTVQWEGKVFPPATPAGWTSVLKWTGDITSALLLPPAKTYDTGGTKKATFSASLTKGEDVFSDKWDCETPQPPLPPPLPDLVGNKPVISGTPTGNPNEFYVGNTTISGTVSNIGDISAHANFPNTYQVRVNGSNTAFGSWLPPKYLNPSTPATIDPTDTTPRNVDPGNWTAGPGIYDFELCADYPLPGGISEKDETNNCGSKRGIAYITTATFVSQTSLTVRSTLDGPDAPGVTITQLSGTPTGMGGVTGTTDYPKQKAASINSVVLQAPVDGPSASKFVGWVGCDATSAPTGETLKRNCAVSVAAGKARTVDAQYGKLCTVDVKFNNADGPVTMPNNTSGTISWTSTSPTPVTITVSTDPANANWTGIKGASGSVSSGNLSPEQRHTFNISCSNSAGPGGTDFVDVNTVSGTLSCPSTPPQQKQNSVDVSYSYANAQGYVSLLRNGVFLTSFPSGPGSGTYMDNGLTPNTSYTYTLRDVAPDKQIDLAVTNPACTTLALPDLTSTLSLTGLTATGRTANGIPEYYALDQATLQGTGKDESTATASSPGTFASVYFYRANNGAWTPFVGGDGKTLVNQDGTLNATPLSPGISRLIQNHKWTPGPTPNTFYHFRVCADTPMPNGSVPESVEGETSNCSTVGPYTFVERPKPTADLFVDGKLPGYDGSITVPYNATVKLTWTSGNTASCGSSDFTTGDARENATGVSVGPLKSTRTYKISCPGTPVTAPQGSPVPVALDVVTITVAPPLTPTVDLLIDGQLAGTGGAVTRAFDATGKLTWTSRNAASCRSSGADSFVANGAANNATGVLVGPFEKTPYGYAVTCIGTPEAAGVEVTDTVAVTVEPPKVSCAPDQSSLLVNEPAVWRPTVTPGVPQTGSYSFAWTSSGGNPASFTGNPYLPSYSSAGTWSAKVTLTAPGNRTVPDVPCGSVTVTAQPDLTASLPELQGLVPTGASAPEYYVSNVTLQGSVSNQGDTSSSGKFVSNYQWSFTPSREESWTFWQDTSLQDDSALPEGTSGRKTAPFTWKTGADGKQWYFRLCADQYNANKQGTITEKNETNNCSRPIGPYTFVERPRPAVTLKATPRVFYGAPAEIEWEGANTSSCTGTGFTTDGKKSGKVTVGPLVNPSYPWSIACQGVSGASPSSVSVQASTSVDPPAVSCAPNPASAFTKQEIAWKAKVTPPTPPSGVYAFAWEGTDISGASGNPLPFAYQTSGEKNATVTLRAPGERTLHTKCSPAQIKPRPVIGVTLLVNGKKADDIITGERATLSWKTSGAPESCTASADWSGRKENQGTEPAGPLDRKPVYAYTITCAKEDAEPETVSDTVKVRLIPAPSCAPDKPTVFVGEKVNWTAVVKHPSQYTLLWASPDNAVRGNESPTSVFYDTPGTKRAGITAFANGLSSGEVACTGAVEVKERPVASVDLTVDNQLVGQDGNITVEYGTPHILRWTSKAVTSCTGTGFATGGATANPTGVPTGGLTNEKYTYTITCPAVSGALVSPVTDYLTVTVKSPTVFCTANKTSAFVGEEVIWTASAPSGSSFSWEKTGAAEPPGNKATYSTSYITSGAQNAKLSSVTAPGDRIVRDISCGTVIIRERPIASVDLKIDGKDSLPIQDYGSSHTFTWSGANLEKDSCVSREFETDGATSNQTGVGTGALVKETNRYRITCQAKVPATNEAGVVGGDVTDTVTVSVKAPTASCKTDQPAYFVGEEVIWKPSAPPGSTNFRWSSPNATPPSGEGSAYKTSYATAVQQTATLSATAPGDRALTASCTVTVKPRPVISVDLKVNGQDSPATTPLELPYGAKSTLSWTTTGDPDSCTASLDWSGGKDTEKGNEIVGPLDRKSAYDFTLSCSKQGALSPATDSVRVRITPTVSCAADKNSAFTGEPVSWKAVVQSPTQYTLLWSGSENLSGSANPIQKIYAATGEKTARATVTADGLTNVAECTTPQGTFEVEIKTFPDLTANAPSISGLTPVSGKTNTYYEGTATLSGSVNNIGAASADGSFKSRYRSRVKGTAPWTDRGQAPLVSPDALPPLPATAANTARPVAPSFSFSLSAGTAAGGTTYELDLCADSFSSIAESNEGNNCSSNRTDVIGIITITVVERPVISVDLKVNGQDSPTTNPIALPYGARPTLSWTTTGDPDSCTASLDWSGGKDTEKGNEIVGPLDRKSAYDFTLSCSKQGALQPAVDTVRVKIAPVVSCAADKNSAFVGETVAWSATVQSPTQYTLLWSGSENLSGSANPIQKIYAATGEKTARISVTADGLTTTADCKAPDGSAGPDIQAFPDLTATPPTVSGTKIGEIFVAKTSLTLTDAFVKNEGTAPASIGAAYHSLYQYKHGLEPWVDLSPAPNFSDTSPLPVGASRLVPSANFTPTVSDSYEFRVCADQNADGKPGYDPAAGTVAERTLSGDAESEGSNCSAATRVEVANAPTVTVFSTRNVSPSTGVPIAGSQTGTGGTTAGASGSYTVTKTEKIDTTLQAPVADLTGAVFTGWSGCNQTSAVSGDPDLMPPRQCAVVAGIGTAKTVTATYVSVLADADLVLEGRVAGAANWSSSVTLPFNQNLELRYRSPSNSCTSGSAVSNPATSWSGPRTITATEKLETVSQPFSVRAYTFDLTCTNTLSRSSLKKTVAVTVVAPDLTANTPTISGLVHPAAGDASYITGVPTFAGSVNNKDATKGGLAETSAPGTFSNYYRIRLSGTGEGGWQTIEVKPLVSTAVVAKGEVNRPVESVTLGYLLGPGEWEVSLCADQPPLPNGAVEEQSETNNCSTSLPVVVVDQPKPDLTVSKAPAPTQSGTLVHGTPYTFTGDVKNIGTARVPDSQSFKNRFQIIRSPEVGGTTETLPNSPSIVGGLDVGAFKSVTSDSWQAVAGKHMLILCADQSDKATESDKVAESDENNNCSPSTIAAGASTVAVYPQPVLVIPTTPTASGDCGGKVLLAYSGGEGATSFTLYRAEGSATATYTALESKTTLGDLRKDAQTGRTIDSVTPDTLFFYKITATGPDELSQTGAPAGARSSKACATSLPELVVDSVKVNGAPVAGQTLTFSGLVRNNSQNAVTKTFANGFTLTPAPGVSFAPVSLAGLGPNSPAPGAPPNVTTASGWSAAAGTYTIQLCADSGKAVPEFDETNNCKSTDFTVSAPTARLSQGPWSLAVQKDGSRASDGRVRSSPSGIDCGGDCAETYLHGELVTLTATAPSGAVFAGWSGAPECVGSASTCIFTMRGQRVITATFNQSGGPLSVRSCAPSPPEARVGGTVTWTAFADGGKSPYTYQWRGEKMTGKSGQSVATSYDTTGTKTAQVRITDSSSPLQDTGWFGDGDPPGEKSCLPVTVKPSLCETEPYALLADPQEIHANFKTGNTSETATITVSTDSCPQFAQTVVFTSVNGVSPKKAGEIDGAVIRLGGQDAVYRSSRDSLAPSQYTLGAAASLEKQGKAVPDGTYPISLCSQGGRFSDCVDLSLIVDSNWKGRAAPLPVFEEF